MQESPQFQLGGAVAGPLPAAGPRPSSSAATPACPSTAQQHSPDCQAAPGGRPRPPRAGLACLSVTGVCAGRTVVMSWAA
jgi:hypothetical protein